ncbi:MAG: hypothetical protein WBF33_18695 [Candidatus Nitrosopolaris sp.]|jgi:hypothetical protein
MLHREAFRVRQRKQHNQDPDNEITAEETVKDSRCPLQPTVENDLRIIARQAGLTHCEQLEKFVVQGIEFKKLQNECARAEGSVRDERCKYVNPPK